MDSPITEDDLRYPQFRGVKTSELERRADGKIVRKDRWQTAIESIRFLVGIDGREYEIPEVVAAVERLTEDVHGWEEPSSDRTFADDELPPARKLVDVKLEDGTLLRGAVYESKAQGWFWLGVAVPLPVIAWKMRRKADAVPADGNT